MFDLIIKNARLANSDKSVDIGVKDGKIQTVEDKLAGTTNKMIDAENSFVTPPFVDPHFHLDAALSYGQPRVNQSGTLLEGIALWGELNPTQSIDDFKARALEFCHWSIARGVLALRSHVDISDERLFAVQALLEIRETMKPYMDIQLVAFPQNGYLRSPGAIREPETCA